jgi:hypothetical protein
MSHPIFVAWKGTDHDALRMTGLGAHGQWECYPFAGLLIGIVHADHPNARADMRELNKNLVVLPGPNGNFNAEHVKELLAHWPTMKEGDAFRTVLSLVHKLYGLDVLDPDNY